MLRIFSTVLKVLNFLKLRFGGCGDRLMSGAWLLYSKYRFFVDIPFLLTAWVELTGIARFRPNWGFTDSGQVRSWSKRFGGCSYAERYPSIPPNKFWVCCRFVRATHNHELRARTGKFCRRAFINSTGISDRINPWIELTYRFQTSSWKTQAVLPAQSLGPGILECFEESNILQAPSAVQGTLLVQKT